MRQLLNISHLVTNLPQSHNLYLCIIYVQKAEVLRKLYIYMNPQYGLPPYDQANVQQTHEYLRACNMLFENGFLSHDKIRDENADVLTSIQEGYSFFPRWYEAIEPHDFQPTSSLERRFLAWQTWDLLRVSVYGFNTFCRDFSSASSRILLNST